MSGNMRAIIFLFLLASTSLMTNGLREMVAQGGLDVEIECYLTVDELRFLGQLQVLWKWKPLNETNWLPLPRDAEIHKRDLETNGSEAQEEVPIATVVLSTVSIYQSGFYACYFEGWGFNLDETRLLVGYPPDIPARRPCETNGCLSFMTCFWDPGQETYLPTSYQLMLAVETGLSWENRTMPASKDRVTINVEKSYLFPHYLKVEAKNTLAAAISDVWITNPFNTVKPDPPTDVIISNNNATAGDTTCSVWISWNPPDKNTMLVLSYAVRRRRSNRNDAWEQYTVDDTSFFATNLAPYTNYDFQVASMPAPSSFYSGFVSDWTEIAVHRTELLAPLERLEFRNIVAVKAPAGDVSRWKVEAEWQVYKGFNQPGFYYDISCSLSQSISQEKIRRNNFTFYISGKGRLTLTGKHCNNVGCSTETVEYVDLDLALSPVETVSLSFHSDEAVVTWNLNENINLNKSCVIQLCSGSRSAFNIFPPSEDDTLDEEDPSLCREVNVLCSAQESRFDFVPSPCRQYQAFVSRVFESGILKIMTPSLPSQNQTVDPPITRLVGFWAQDGTYDAKSYRIITRWSWKESLCTNMHDHLRFSIIYSPYNGSECIDRVCPPAFPFQETIPGCSESLFQHEITTNLYGGTLYDVELGYCCKALPQTPPLCFPAIAVSDTAKTPIGTPDPPQALNWRASDPLEVYWNPPEHRNGDVDGYRFQYGEVKNSTDGLTDDEPTKFTELMTTETKIEVPIKCVSLDEGTIYQIRVAAYNLASGKKLFGSVIQQEAPLCLYVNPDSIYLEKKNNYSAVVAGICSCFGFILLTLAIGFCQRRHLKKVVRKHVWPSVPAPDVQIQFSESVDKDGNRYKNVYDEELTYSNTAYCDNNRRDGDDLSCREIPDDIRDCACHSPMDSNPFSSNASGKNNNKLIKEDTVVMDGILSCKPSVAVDEVFTRAKFEDGINNKTFLIVESCQSTATWRSVLYPSFSSSAKDTARSRRSHSFSGSSGGSFNVASYVKNCSGEDLRLLAKNQSKSSQVGLSTSVQYTKLASAGDVSSGTSCTAVSTKEARSLKQISNQTSSCDQTETPENVSFIRKKRSVPINVRRCRGESWYDGYSTYNATHYLPTFKADILSDSPSSSRSDSPYVSLPTPDNILKLHGSTLDSTSDDSEVFDQKLNHSTDSSDQNSTESLELFQPVHSADMLPWDSADPPYSFESNLSNWSPTGLTKKPLLECYSPPPVVDNNTSYITMSEALENPGFRQGLSHMENEKNFTGKPSLYPLKFDFGLNDGMFSNSSSNATAPYVLQMSPNENKTSELSYAEFDQVAASKSDLSSFPQADICRR